MVIALKDFSSVSCPNGLAKVTYLPETHLPYIFNAAGRVKATTTFKEGATWSNEHGADFNPEDEVQHV